MGSKGSKLYRGSNINENNIFENGILNAFQVTDAGGNAPLFNQIFKGLNISGVGVVDGVNIIAVVMSFTTGVLSTPEIKITAWHHWGAYIGPAELALSGARIFYDFPAQYGFGPTLLIASACGNNCWIAMYFIAGGAALAFALLGFFIISGLPVRTLAALGVIVGATAVGCLLWVAYPPLVSSALVAPSPRVCGSCRRWRLW